VIGETELPEEKHPPVNYRSRRSDQSKVQSGGRNRDSIGVKPSRRKDDLTRINGIGAATSKQLYALNITSFDQISSLTDDQLNILQKEYFYEQDIRKQNWVAQAKRLTKSKV